MPTSKEARAFYARPFESGVTTLASRKSNTFTPRMCANCGSVKLQAKGPEYPRFFCDVECRSEFKRIHNKSAEYQAKCGIDVAREAKRNAEESIRIQKAKSRIEKARCCSWCGNVAVMLSFQKFCKGCRKERNAYRASIMDGGYKAGQDLTCLHCGKVFSVTKYGSINGQPKKYCSLRCCEKAARRNRRHRLRRLEQEGLSDFIHLSVLLKAYNGRCVSCNVVCTESDDTGFSKPTDATIDHIIPIAKGGYHTVDNVQLMCMLCNSKKTDSLTANTQLLLLLTGG